MAYFKTEFGERKNKMSITAMARKIKHEKVRIWANERRGEIMRLANYQCADCHSTKQLTMHHTQKK